jgi:hypothetical protein
MDTTQRKIRQVQRMAATAQPLQPAENHPGPGRGHTKKPNEKAKAGNRSDYLVARMARDRPDIMERMKAGEFSSVSEAARAAGSVRDTWTALKGTAPLVDQVVGLWANATSVERQTIREHLHRKNAMRHVHRNPTPKLCKERDERT